MKDRTLLKFTIDLLLWTIAIPAAYLLRVEAQLLPNFSDVALLMLIFLPVKGFTLNFFRLHRQSWHNTSIIDLFLLTKAIAVVFVLLIASLVFLRNFLFVPLSIPFIQAMLAFLLMGSVRILARLHFEQRDKKIRAKSKHPPKKVLIAGAGVAGNLLLREIMRHPEVKMKPIGFIDDDPAKQKERFMGVPVLGSLHDLPGVISEKDADMVLIAMPAARGKIIRDVVEVAKESGVEFKIMPAIYELISSRFNISQLREVDVQDLLRRDHVKLDYKSISDYIKNKVVMVTGAGGSIGSEIVRQITRCRPRQILLLGRGENSIFKVESECLQKYPHIDFVTLITDVKDVDMLDKHFSKYSPDVVFHAAAHKHVTLMENNPEQAIFNNVAGTRSMVDMALKYNVRRFVNVSSDKSVNPTSVMGASKRVAEYVVEWGSCLASEGQEFVSVRFGNVLGSRGSVVPLFKQQIENGGPLTITHPEMARYFMTIPEASQLVVQAGGLGGNGSVYVLDMGEPVKIVDLAYDLIKLSGMRPNEDIDIMYTGMRPGEKMCEELLTEEENTNATSHTKIFSAKTSGYPGKRFEDMLEKLFEMAQRQDGKGIRKQLKAIIPTYEYEGKPPEVPETAQKAGASSAAGTPGDN